MNFSTHSGRVGIRNISDYSAFGVLLKERTVEGEFFRSGYNGKEIDPEVKGKGNSYDFGARMYDCRIGRFLVLDNQSKKMPANSGYSYAVNSPILYIDFYGDHPKVAIIVGVEGEKNAEKPFKTHKAALEKQGYKVVYAKTGAEALKKMGELSTPESPIEDLILISHGSPGGVSNGGGGGIYTESEVQDLAKSDWIKNRKLELIDSYNKNPETFPEDVNIWDQADQEAEKFWGGITEENVNAQNEYIQAYKEKTGAITPKDITEALNGGIIHFAEDRTVVLGGCNTGGYPTDDGQEIFSSSLAVEINATVYSSRGWTGPIWGTSKRVSNSTQTSRDLKGTWMRTDPEGNSQSTGSSTLDMSNPK